MPNTSSVNTKNTLLAKPTDAIAVEPKLPIIKLSTRFTTVFSIPCMATGRAIITVFLKKFLSRNISFVSLAIPVMLCPF